MIYEAFPLLLFKLFHNFIFSIIQWHGIISVSFTYKAFCHSSSLPSDEVLPVVELLALGFWSCELFNTWLLIKPHLK